MGIEPAAEALLQEGNVKKQAALFADYAGMLRSKSDATTLKATVSELEGKMAKLKSNIQQLQNQVRGNGSQSSSLLAIGAAKAGVAPRGSSLESRTEALENDVSTARTDVTSIEQVVVG